MADLAKAQIEGEPVFTESMQEYMSKVDEYPKHSFKDEIEAAKALTEEELYWIVIDSFDSFETSHESYKSPPQELLEKAGCLVPFFKGMMCESMSQYEF